MPQTMKIVCIVQARTSSTRLPRKVLKALPYGGDVSVLGHVIRRLKKCHRLDDVIVATTTDKEDVEIVNIAEQEQVKWFRGSREDVLARYYWTAKEHDASVIVRITSDCPCIDPQIVDHVVDTHLRTHADYTSNTLTRMFPHGMDTAVLSFQTLEKAHREAGQAFEREHVCPYIYKSNPQAFKISSVEAPESLRGPDIRITLDTEEDYALLCAVFDYLYSENEFFDAKDIIELFHHKPWLKTINKKVIHKKTFDSFNEEIEEAIRILDFQQLHGAKKLLMEHLK